MPTSKKRKALQVSASRTSFASARDKLFRDDEQNKRSFPGQCKRNYKLTTMPLIDSKRPGWLRLNNRRINEILFS